MQENFMLQLQPSQPRLGLLQLVPKPVGVAKLLSHRGPRHLHVRPRSARQLIPQQLDGFLRREEVLPIRAETYGADAHAWLQRWRIFFMSCAELFGAHGGREWYVAHALYERAA